MGTEKFPQLPILMVDDEPSWLKSCSLMLEYEANLNNISMCSDSRKVMSLLEHEEFSLVLLDLTMPYVSGDELLMEIKVCFPDLPVIILSGLNQIETAVACMKSGAYDYFVKTDEKERLVTAIRNILELRSLQHQNRLLRKSLLREDDSSCTPAFAPIITNSPKMKSIFSYVEAVAKSSEPVLLIGESGVGKELFTQAIHDLSRPKEKLVTFNVAGIDDNVFSDTLFGHKKGAYTGAVDERPGMISKAGFGTILLDEIGDLSPGSQVKLLRLLQDGEYYPLGSDTPSYSNVRFICATNHDLAEKQMSGDFRKDLFYRLNTHLVNIPPLRERPDDIALLLTHFVAQASREMNVEVSGVPKELPFLLSKHPFPGNIRELRAMVYDAVSQHKTGMLSTTPFELKLGLEGDAAGMAMTTAVPDGTELFGGISPLPSLKEICDLLVDEAMERSGSNQSIASGMLGITRQALGKRLRKQQEE